MADNRNREDDSNELSSGDLNETARNMNADGLNDAPSETEPAQPTTSFSQASQVGRVQTGGPPDSALEPRESTREGWDIPDQRDTPPEWPEPTID